MCHTAEQSTALKADIYFLPTLRSNCQASTHVVLRVSMDRIGECSRLSFGHVTAGLQHASTQECSNVSLCMLPMLSCRSGVLASFAQNQMQLGNAYEKQLRHGSNFLLALTAQSMRATSGALDSQRIPTASVCNCWRDLISECCMLLTNRLQEVESTMWCCRRGFSNFRVGIRRSST